MPQLLYNGDAFKMLNHLAVNGVKLPFLFADPPDNLGLDYDGYKDKISADKYRSMLTELIDYGRLASIFWLSYYHVHDATVMRFVADLMDDGGWSWRKLIWRFTFGQHRTTDFGSGYRPLLRLVENGVDLSEFISRIRVRSARQELGDPRANAEGRVPDDVWDIPRVVGNAIERRPWHPTQHPEALLERIILSSGGKSLKLVTDAFAGTGSLLRVADRLGIAALGSEQSATYCKMISLGLPDLTVTTSLDEVTEFVQLNSVKSP